MHTADLEIDYEQYNAPDYSPLYFDTVHLAIEDVLQQHASNLNMEECLEHIEPLKIVGRNLRDGNMYAYWACSLSYGEMREIVVESRREIARWHIYATQ